MPFGRWGPLAHPEIAEVEVDEVLKALADPTRRQIVRMLIADGDRACGTFGLKVSASTLSHHFRALRQAGIIEQYDEGRKRMNRLRLEELGERFPGLVGTILDAAGQA